MLAANILLGEGGDDVLSGGGGTDRLLGSYGNDTLTGGLDNDVFVFNTPLNATTNRDTITDFSAPQDTIQLENAFFTRARRQRHAEPRLLLRGRGRARRQRLHRLQPVDRRPLLRRRRQRRRRQRSSSRPSPTGRQSPMPTSSDDLKTAAVVAEPAVASPPPSTLLRRPRFRHAAHHARDFPVTSSEFPARRLPHFSPIGAYTRFGWHAGFGVRRGEPTARTDGPVNRLSHLSMTALGMAVLIGAAGCTRTSDGSYVMRKPVALTRLLGPAGAIPLPPTPPRSTSRAISRRSAPPHRRPPAASSSPRRR